MEVSDRWPGHIKAFRSAVANLENLKKWQYTVDKAEGTCRADEETAQTGNRKIPEC